MGMAADLIRLAAVRSRSGFRSALELFHRRGIPVLSLPGGRQHLVLGAEEVRDALRRPDDFLAGAPKSAKLEFMPFILGMDRNDAYLEQRGQLEAIVLGNLGVPRFEKLAHEVAEREAQQLIELARTGAKVDLISRFTDRVVYGTTAAFHDLPIGQDFPRSRVIDAEPGVRTFALWVRKLGLPVGYARPESFGVARTAELVRDELRDYVLTELEKVEKEPGHAPHSLIRLLSQAAPPRGDSAERKAFEQNLLARVCGLLAASIALTKAVNHCVDEILRRPAVRDQVASLARAEDYDTLRLYAWEALRFRPAFPVLVRHVPRATQLRLRAGGVREIAAGSEVQLATCAAMFDPASVDRPEVFLPSRFETQGGDLLGLQFGFPIRNCLGQGLAAVALPRILGALFRHESFARARPGRIEWDGLTLDRYWLDLEVNA